MDAIKIYPTKNKKKILILTFVSVNVSYLRLIWTLFELHK